MENSLPSIPAKRYFTIGEAADLCGVKPHVLRYWEQEFTQLRPMKRRGNRRYYQHHEVLMIRRIRELLYDQGFTISGARHQLQELAHPGRSAGEASGLNGHAVADGTDADTHHGLMLDGKPGVLPSLEERHWQEQVRVLKRELHAIRDLLTPTGFGEQRAL